MSEFKHLATITKPKRKYFHLYVHPSTSPLLLHCTVDDDREPALNKNVMEYWPSEKWIVLKDFLVINKQKEIGIKDRNGNKVRKGGTYNPRKPVYGLKIEDYILNKIFWNHRFNISEKEDPKAPEYTYENYLNYIRYTKSKKGYRVRICKVCNGATLVSTIQGHSIYHYSTFVSLKKALETRPLNSAPLIYHMTDKYYFVPIKSEKGKSFICYKCLTGKYYRNSYLYDMERHGWKHLDSEKQHYQRPISRLEES